MTVTTPKRPLARIDVPNLVMKLAEYDTEELQAYYAIFNTCVDQLYDRYKDRRLRMDVRRKAHDKLKKARKKRNQIRGTLLARGADLEPEPEEWETVENTVWEEHADTT